MGTGLYINFRLSLVQFDQTAGFRQILKGRRDQFTHSYHHVKLYGEFHRAFLKYRWGPGKVYREARKIGPPENGF